MALQHQVDGGVQQGAAGTDEHGPGLLVHMSLVEADPLVTPDHGIASADDAVPVPDGGRYV